MKTILLLVVCCLLSACIGIPGKVERSSSDVQLNAKPVRIIFTGFTKYYEEEKEISQELDHLGFKEDLNSETLLEVIIEEVEPKYKRPFLHFSNLVLSIGTVTILPYHNQTVHRIRILLRERGIIIEEISLQSQFHQWRGLSLLPFTYFYWPSTEFRKFLAQTFQKEMGIKK